MIFRHYRELVRSTDAERGSFPATGKNGQLIGDVRLRKRLWAVLRFWDCQLKDAARVSRRISKALSIAL